MQTKLTDELNQIINKLLIIIMSGEGDWTWCWVCVGVFRNKKLEISQMIPIYEVIISPHIVY